MTPSDVERVSSLLLVCLGAVFMLCGAWKHFSGDSAGAIFYAVEACALLLLARS